MKFTTVRKRQGTRRPKATWGQFLDCAPHFIEAMWVESDCIAQEYAPLVRAVAYFSIFRGQVENGGIAQYLYNKADALPDFVDAPEIVRQHPLLQAIADLMLTAHSDKEMVSHYVRARKEQNEIIQHYIRTREGGDTPITYEDKYRVFSDDYNKRAYQMNEKAMVQVHADLLKNPLAYLDIDGPTGVAGAGVEYTELEGSHGKWEARFVNGFPIGPNFHTDRAGNRRIMRFTDNRMHIEFDHPVFEENEPTREWYDYSAGVGGARSFKGGALACVSGTRWLVDEHGLREYFDPSGSSRSASATLGGVRIDMYHPGSEGSPFKITTPSPDGGRITRKYFANGQLNIVQEHDPSGPGFRTTHCYDEAGADLAPGGSGACRELWSADENGLCWRIGRLVDGHLDGDVRYVSSDGTEWRKEQWAMGRLKHGS